MAHIHSHESSVLTLTHYRAYTWQLLSPHAITSDPTRVPHIFTTNKECQLHRSRAGKVRASPEKLHTNVRTIHQVVHPQSYKKGVFLLGLSINIATWLQDAAALDDCSAAIKLWKLCRAIQCEQCPLEQSLSCWYGLIIIVKARDTVT